MQKFATLKKCRTLNPNSFNFKYTSTVCPPIPLLKNVVENSDPQRTLRNYYTLYIVQHSVCTAGKCRSKVLLLCTKLAGLYPGVQDSDTVSGTMAGDGNAKDWKFRRRKLEDWRSDKLRLSSPTNRLVSP